MACGQTQTFLRTRQSECECTAGVLNYRYDAWAGVRMDKLCVYMCVSMKCHAMPFHSRPKTMQGCTIHSIQPSFRQSLTWIKSNWIFLCRVVSTRSPMSVAFYDALSAHSIWYFIFLCVFVSLHQLAFIRLTLASAFPLT